MAFGVATRNHAIRYPLLEMIPFLGDDFVYIYRTTTTISITKTLGFFFRRKRLDHLWGASYRSHFYMHIYIRKELLGPCDVASKDG
jgi:hypothetical protein